MATITRQEALDYLSRWQVASSAERQELRDTSMDVRFRQLAALMASTHLFGDAADHARSNLEVSERWIRIRRAYDL